MFYFVFSLYKLAMLVDHNLPSMKLVDCNKKRQIFAATDSKSLLFCKFLHKREAKICLKNRVSLDFSVYLLWSGFNERCASFNNVHSLHFSHVGKLKTKSSFWCSEVSWLLMCLFWCAWQLPFVVNTVIDKWSATFPQNK